MDEARKLDLRPFLTVLAIAAVAATVWAAVALAAGGSSSPPSSGTANDGSPSFIQSQDNQAPPADDNCPDGEGGSGGGSGSNTDPNGSGSSDL
jgi:hypothetical protein